MALSNLLDLGFDRSRLAAQRQIAGRPRPHGVPLQTAPRTGSPAEPGDEGDEEHHQKEDEQSHAFDPFF